MPFETTIEVHFGDTDPARIVYYPVFFHYCHIAFERFFNQFVGMPYARLIEQERLGFPTVETSASFHRPVRYGDELVVALAVTHIGTSSAHFRYQGRVGADTRFEARTVNVAVSMETFTPVPMPQYLRDAFARCRED